MQDNYHMVYSGLAFFIEESLFVDFNGSLDIIVNGYMRSMEVMGHPINESSCRNIIASSSVWAKSREEIWNSLLAHEKVIGNGVSELRLHIIKLAEVLDYCGSMYRAMWDEWAAYANLTAFQHRNKN